MMILVTYDVGTSTPEGEKRLRSVAKICKNHGIRVQHSVFECSINPAQFINLKSMLSDVIDLEHDSIRIYHLSSKKINDVEILGKAPTFSVDSTIII